QPTHQGEADDGKGVQQQQALALEGGLARHIAAGQGTATMIAEAATSSNDLILLQRGYACLQSIACARHCKEVLQGGAMLGGPSCDVLPWRRVTAQGWALQCHASITPTIGTRADQPPQSRRQ
ncbi:hypothetical protein, partial [Neoaquamicrobium sediminum]|uniref:hypothetical protein n=1 Tax=Neoaquamicrobium sediminum TaxID=1849104 RepID=UPI004036CA1B